MAMANIFDNERIRKWTIIGAVLGGIAPIATLSENQSLTIPDILLGALTIGSIFGFVGGIKGYWSSTGSGLTASGIDDKLGTVFNAGTENTNNVRAVRSF